MAYYDYQNENQLQDTGGNVIFEEDALHSAHHVQPRHESRLAHFLVKHSRGYIKNEIDASHILIAVTAVCFLLSFIFFWLALGYIGPQKIELVAPAGKVLVNPVTAPPHIRN